MVKKKTVHHRANMADIAGGRAKFYDLLVGIFSNLPDKHFLVKIKGYDLQHFLDTCCDLDSSRFKSGVDCINSYQNVMENKPEEEVLNELSVDRTRILRGTGHENLTPPYEGLYKGGKNFGESLLEIKRFYRKAGLMPEDTVHESPDYICIELDFMKHLCLREQDQWSSDLDVSETIAHEEAFLKRHLGSWVGNFCQQVEKHALTDFYRGFALILDAFITMDMAFLNQLDLEPRPLFMPCA